MPSVVKKTAANRSRSGPIWPVMWCRKGVPESTNPARNAPSSRLKPIAWVVTAAAIAIATDTIINTSVEPRRADSCNRRGSRSRPSTITPPRPMSRIAASRRNRGQPLIDSAARSLTMIISPPVPDHRARAGSAASIAMTTMSCTTRMERARRPLVWCSSRRWAMMRSTTAVEERLKAMATTSAAGAGSPKSPATGQPRPTDRKQEPRPTPTMRSRPCLSTDKCSCKPIPNSSRMMASLEIASRLSDDPTNPSACGPTTAPVSR